MKIPNQLTMEIQQTISIKRSLFYFLFLLFPFLLFFSQYQSYAFFDTYDVFTFFFDGAMSLVFVALAILIYTVSFSHQLTNRFLVYTRTRAPIHQTLLAKFTWNASVTFLAFFMMTMLITLFTFYLLPLSNLVDFTYVDAGLTAEAALAQSAERHPFSTLLAVSPLLYGTSYATWLGANAALYSSLAFLLLLLIENRFVALTLPVVFYIVSTMVVGMLGYGILQPVQSIFPFGMTNQPTWSVFIPFACVLLGVTILAIFAKKKVQTLQ